MFTDDDWQEMLVDAEWSDRFFNYVPSMQAYMEGDDALAEVAQQFIETNKDCPFGVDWLVKDFFRRL